jgi:lipoprotein-anchoring transpeptidase ErfK/SrfK
VELIFSKSPTSDSKVYVVERGDNLTNIGMKLNTTQGLLMRANGLSKETTLNVGDRLKYTPKDFRIVIERSTCRLFLLDSDGLFKRYTVGLGRPGHETTLGEFRIGNKQIDPTWYKPNAGPIPPGDPRNELGSRWMPLVPEREELPTDLGIHGTVSPETIGKHSSSGCARMHNAEVEELYDLVVRSTPVEIVETVDPAEFGL